VSIEFEPVKVETQPRRVDPLVVGVIVVAISLVVAIGKPWDQGLAADQSLSFVTAVAASVAPSVVPSIAQSPSPIPIVRGMAPKSPVASPPTWTELAPFLTAHDAWGVRILLNGRPTLYGAPASPRFVDRWSPATTDATGVETADVAGDDRSIESLGVTFPRAEMPLDARIWRVHRNEQLEWVEAIPIDPGNADGSFLYLRPAPDGSRFKEWEAGRYRIDVLVRDGVHRIVVDVPGRFDSVPLPDDRMYTPQGIIPASLSHPPAVFSGL